ncbi:ASCH domain-containing protein [Dickeya solani]|uniref:Morphogenetic protein n=1 Tax=Dickeya solani TaxID=1089444 RepID=A0ABU4EH99_9GAMM|nr:hypothetical protein [Dickeya solani]MCZ0823691.1 hypothetical protein [Dickeya solani]MDV6995598.1 hypothetical protein [Dickeya solani]MDV7002877.1 hypothetical protein [Dickeya solani]MDV7036653.1 hypothetical protein [Dickeya solani]MDV7043406.1 hypothetical protein [Dickeya solani]
MKERGMIFNADMVRAILDGRKTQTRRIIKLSHERGMVNPVVRGKNGEISSVTCRLAPTLSPHGGVGDRLWVRETFSCIGNEDGHPINANGDLCERENAQRIYKASSIQKLNNYGLWTSPDGFDFEGRWTPSIHMPRWASRITLEITGVRVERLNSISEEDAQAEGISPATYMITPPEAAYRVGFRHLWESIYGEESWQGNPWVWVIEFRRVEA